jgi:hypothetical protein
VCKQDVVIVADASLSITPNGLNTVKNAIARFLQPMQSKGGNVNIVSFNNGGIGTSNSSLTQITTGGWVTVASNSSTLPNPIVLGGTRTDWDDALKRASLITGAPLGLPPLYLFITDGEPTAYIDNTSTLEIDATNTPVTAATEAVQWINQIRQTSPIIAIGFGPVTPLGYLDAAFTGNVSGPGSINFETSSVIKMDSVNDLPGVMAALGNQMCGTLSLNKRVTAGPTFIHAVTPTGATSVSVNDTIPFTLELTNNHATMSVAGIEVQDQVPTPALSNVTVAPPTNGSSPPIPPGNLIKWSGITLAPRTTATLSFTGKFVKTYPAPAVNVPTVETYPNYAQVTAALNYNATALGNMNPVSGPATEVDESLATFTEYVYVPPPDQCAGATKPPFCYVQVSKVQNNPENCTPATGGNCQYAISVSLNSTNIPAGSTVTVVDTFMVGTAPLTSAWNATVPASFCSGTAPTTLPFTCNHGSLTSFSGVMSVAIPSGQNAGLKNCITVTVANMANTTPPTVSATACAP